MNVRLPRLATRLMGLGVAGLLGIAMPALGAVTAPHFVLTGSMDELVILENYDDTNGGSPVSVELVRGGLVIGKAGPFTPPAVPPGQEGGIEIGHPVDVGQVPDCWADFTPDMVNGDIVRITQGGSVDTSEVRNIVVQEQVDVDPLTVEVHGSAQDALGNRLPLAELEVLLLNNPAFSGNGLFAGGPVIIAPGAEAGTGGTVTGTLDYDGPAPNPNFTATFVFSQASSQDIAADPAQSDVEAGWLTPTEGAEVGVGPEALEPGLVGCAAPTRYTTTKTTPNVVNNDTPTLDVEGAAPSDATTVSVTLSDGNALTTDPTVTGTLTQPVGVGGKIWTAQFIDNDIDNLDDGVLTATPTFDGTIAGRPKTVLKNASGDPEVTITSPTPGATLTTSNVPVVFNSAATDVTFDCRRDGGSIVPCTSPHLFTAVQNGPHTFEVRANDNGNLGPFASVSVTVARPTPVVSFTQTPAVFSNQNPATFQFTASPPAGFFECSLNGAAFTPCTSPYSTGPLTDGANELRVRAGDDAGNLSVLAAEHDWTVDTAAPNTTLVSGPAADIKTTTADFAMTSSETPQLFECRLDGGAFQTCTSPHTISNLTDGAHVVDIRAKDQAGNVDPSPVTANFTVKGPPNTFFNAAPPATTTATTATFGFVSNDSAATFECSLDGAAFSFCVSPITVTGLSLGSHTFRVRAIDILSTPDPTPATHAWQVVLPDTEAPTVTSRLGPVGKLTVARNGVLVVPTTCDEACTIIVRARVVVPSSRPGGKTRVFRLTSTPVATSTGTTGRPRVKLNPIMLQAVRASLRAGKNVRITLTVSAKDAAGNEGIAIPAITLTRRNL